MRRARDVDLVTSAGWNSRGSDVRNMNTCTARSTLKSGRVAGLQTRPGAWAKIAAMRAAVVIIAALLLAACPASQSQRCKQLCQQQIACIESLDKSDILIDENECTSACSALERDSEGLERVNQHESCINEAKSCEERLACQ